MKVKDLPAPPPPRTWIQILINLECKGKGFAGPLKALLWPQGLHGPHTETLWAILGILQGKNWAFFLTVSQVHQKCSEMFAQEIRKL